MNEIIHGYVVSVILTKFRINANIQLWQSFSILNFEIGIVSDFLQYINPWVAPKRLPEFSFLQLSWVPKTETANWAESGQLQFWSKPSEVLNLRSSNTPKTAAFTIP